MFKKNLFLGMATGIGASIAALTWNYVFNIIIWEELFDFRAIIHTGSIFGACMFTSVIASIGHFVATKYVKNWGELIFAVIFALISIASIISPIQANLSEYGISADDQTYFPMLAMPMHFFPFLAWFTLKSLFFKTETES